MAENITSIVGPTYKRFHVSLINPTRPFQKNVQNTYYSYDYVETQAPGTDTLSYFSGGENYFNTTADYIDTHMWTGTVGSVSNLGYTLRPTTHPLYNEVTSAALSKLYSFVKKGKHSGFNFAVSVAEADKALQTIFIAATRVFAFYKALRRGRLGDAYNSLGIAQHQSAVTRRLLLDEFRNGITAKEERIKVGARRYPRPKTVRENASAYMLETKYGWLPLLNDVKSAAEKVASVILDEPTPFIVRARANGKMNYAGNGDLTSDPVNTAHWNSFLVDGIRAQYVVRYKFQSEYLAMAASLGLTNPMAVIWETVPFSFLVDWFIPVGTWLENLSAFHGLAVQSCVLSVVRTQVSRYSHSGKPALTVYETFFPQGIETTYIKRQTVSTGGVYEFKSNAFTRTILADVPAPQLLMESKDFTWEKAAVVAALLQQGASHKRTQALSPLF